MILLLWRVCLLLRVALLKWRALLMLLLDGALWRIALLRVAYAGAQWSCAASITASTRSLKICGSTSPHLAMDTCPLQRLGRQRCQFDPPVVDSNSNSCCSTLKRLLVWRFAGVLLAWCFSYVASEVIAMRHEASDAVNPVQQSILVLCAYITGFIQVAACRLFRRNHFTPPLTGMAV